MDFSDVIFYIIIALTIVVPALKKRRSNMVELEAEPIESFSQQESDDEADEKVSGGWGTTQEAKSEPSYFTYETPIEEEPPVREQQVKSEAEQPATETVGERIEEQWFNLREAIIYNTVIEAKYC